MQMVIRNILLSCDSPGTHCTGECARCVLDVAEKSVPVTDGMPMIQAIVTGFADLCWLMLLPFRRKTVYVKNAHKYNTTLIFLDIQKNYEVTKKL